MRIFTIAGLAFSICLFVSLPSKTAEAENTYTVYSVYQALNLGNPGEVPQKDFYVSIGQAQGVRQGSILEVMRRVPTYDLVSQKLYKDMVFPIARLKVIHVEETTAVARLEKMFSPEKTPAISPRAVMVGDFVKLVE